MATRWWARAWLALTLALLAGWTAWPASAADPVAVLTEMRTAGGEVVVRRAGEQEWTVPRALQGLRPGDQVRAAGAGRAALVLVGAGTTLVTAGNSPFTVPAPALDSGADRARRVASAVVQFLAGQPAPPTYRSLSVRGPGEPPRIVAPRATRVLPGPVTFEWSGQARPDYVVRLVGPGGVLWEQGGLPRRALPYPAAAPPLVPATRYAWSVEAPGQTAQRAEFEVVAADEAERIRAGLADLSAAPGPAASTAVLLRAGLLLQEGLQAEARRELLSAIAADPDEPSLHQLLGLVHARVGLHDLAAQEFDEAEFLARRRP